MNQIQGRLVSIGGGVYRVHTPAGVITASVRGRLKQQGLTQLVVGDLVTVDEQGDGYTIEGKLERQNALRRRMPGRKRGIRIVAANIDQVFVVGSLRHPEWDSGLIDRFLAVVEANHIPPVLVVNKVDLAEGPVGAGVPYARAGYPVLEASVEDGTGITGLRTRAEGRVSLFTGSTGVGKSSLVNAIEPGLGARIGQLSERKHTGKHTTVAAEMYELSGGGFVVDTPGLRDVGLWALEPEEVVAAFPEFLPYANECRFDNCRHLSEPQCAVIAARDAGEIAETRLSSYRTLLDEAQQASRHWE